MAIRTRLTLTSLTPNGAGGTVASFLSAPDSAITADEAFTAETNANAFSFQLDNAAAIAQLAVGSSYYLDITAAA